MKESEPVSEYYGGRYESKTLEERMKVVEELCACGDKGKAVMKEIFRKRVYGEQVRIPAGILESYSYSMPEYMEGESEKEIAIKSLYFDKYEVTFEKYWIFLACTMEKMELKTISIGRNNPRITKYVGLGQSVTMYDRVSAYLGKCPVYNVSSEGARAYAEWLGMRLPTADEWAYAARAGSTGKHCIGDSISRLEEYAWFGDKLVNGPQPVGMKKPNEWELHDMHGNAWEITSRGSSVAGRVQGGVFGGYWSDTFPKYTRKPDRLYIGFRCVRDVK
jgi:formylglycine-generating enzyme required for sulfatase activity